MLILCDSYNIPLLFLVDQPGFLIGLEAERRKIAGKVINWMYALSLVTVPKLTLITRKDYGQALVNMGGADTADAIAAWWSAEISFMDPRSALFVVDGIEPDPRSREYVARVEAMSRSSTSYDLAGVYGAHDVIDPARSREWVSGQLRTLLRRRTNGVADHRLSNWPTTF